MTIVNIDVKDLGGVAHPQDRVVFRAPNHRSDGEQVVSTALHTVMLVDGIGSTSLSPGPAVVRLHCQGVADTGEKSIMVPDEGPVTLTGLFDSAGAFTYAPPVVSQVNLAARRAEDAAVRAEGVADAFGSLEGVVDQVQAASDAALSASGSASAASSSASAAATSESNAAGSATSAGNSASAAASSASAAADSASAATGAADSAAGSESQAALSASAAADSASAANSAAASAEAVADSTHWQDDRLSVMGQLGPSLTGPKGDKGDSGDGAGDVLWSEIDPILDGKAPVVHNHHGDYYTKEQADGQYVSASGNTTKAGNLNMDGGSVRYIRPDTTGGWARGLWWMDRDYTEIGGIGAFGNGSVVNYFYLGHGNEPWSAPVFRAYQDRVSITNLEVTGAVTGIEAGDVGAAESSRVTALEDSQPIIVSSLPASPLPGRIYLVTG